MRHHIGIEIHILRVLGDHLIQCRFVKLGIDMGLNIKILKETEIDHVILPLYDGLFIRVGIGADMLAVGLLPDQIRIYADIFDNILYRLVLILLRELVRLQQRTLDMIRSHLEKMKGETCTCDTLAGVVGLSKVTVRRYLNYLAEIGEIDSSVDYETGGRPCIKYFIRPDAPEKKEEEAEAPAETEQEEK